MFKDSKKKKIIKKTTKNAYQQNHSFIKKNYANKIELHKIAFTHFTFIVHKIYPLWKNLTNKTKQNKMLSSVHFNHNLNFKSNFMINLLSK